MNKKAIREWNAGAGVQGLTGLRSPTQPAAVWALALTVMGGVFCLPSPASAQDMDVDTMRRVKRASVLVFTYASKSQKADQTLGSGSGYFINSTGMLITNNHVVDPAHGKSLPEKQQFHYNTGRLTWQVVTDSGIEEQEKSWECDVLYQNEAADQAVLQAYEKPGAKLKTPDFLRFLPESRLKTRMKVWAFGFPGGDSLKTSRDKHPAVTESSGFVTDLPRTPAGRIRGIVTDVLARPGNSGGPMVDIDGFIVGTVTLMGQSEDRANTSALVPAQLSCEFIRAAFNLGRIPEGTDVAPFVDILTNDNGRVNIPGFDRMRDRDVLFYRDGDRIFGTISTDKITWESTLGALEVPTGAVAYVMTDDDGSDLFLEGGNRVSASDVGAKFQFTPEGGAQTEQSFDDIGVVAFKTSTQRVNPVTGKVIVFASDANYLTLADVTGKTKLESRAGVIEIGLDEIARIDTRSDDDKQVVTLIDGRRITGQFQKVPLTAKLAATDTPIQFDLSHVSRATIEVLEQQAVGFGGLDLRGVLASADREILRIADALVAGDGSGARTQIDRLLEPSEFRRLPTVTKDQVYLLDGVAVLRAGDYESAARNLRKANRAQDANLASYAGACAAILKRFGSSHEGKPLSDPVVFTEAGRVLAQELILEVRDLLKERDALEGKKGEYNRIVNAVKKQEESMLVAAVLVGAEADDQRIRLWKLASEVCQREILRLNEELGEVETVDRSGRRSTRTLTGPVSARPTLSQRERDKLRQEREEVRETLVKYEMKLAVYGFRIEDPDIREFRDQQQEDDGPP